MLLIQQSSSSFRVWTSRALMVYFRRALLFLVVSPRQYINNNHCLLEQQQKVYFSDAEDDEEILMIDDKRKYAEVLFDRNENNSNRIEISQSKQHLLKKYVFKKLSQGLNNSMRKSIQNDTTNSPLIESIDESFSDSSSLLFDAIQLPVTKQFELPTCYSNQTPNSFNNTKINANKIPDNSVYQYEVNPSYSSRQQTPIIYHNQTDIPLSYDPYFNNTNSMLSYPVSFIYEKEKKIYYISIYSLAHLAYHYLLFITRSIIKLYHLNQMNHHYQNLLLNIHQLQFNKIYLNHLMMKMIFMKNIKHHFHIFFIKQKVFILSVKKINYNLC